MTDLTTQAAAALLPAATRRMLRTADALPDPGYAEPSGLPGWTRAHVLAHLALNAEGLAAALTGVVEGTTVAVYRSEESRDADIDNLASQGASVLRSRLLGACTDLSDAIAAVPDDASDTTVERVPGGQVFRVRDIPWLRLREVEIHHADLGAGYHRSSWSPEFAVHVIETALSRGGPSEPLVARAVDLARDWTRGSSGMVASGRAVDLAWWLVGRGSGDGVTSEGGALPRIGAW